MRPKLWISVLITYLMYCAAKVQTVINYTNTYADKLSSWLIDDGDDSE